MSAYKVQVKNASGELEDLDLAATYDGDGNEISSSYVKAADLEDGTAVAAEAEHAASADTVGSATVGDETTPVWVNNGTITACSASVGSSYANLESMTWEEINAISISGYAPSVFHIGQEKSVELSSGETVTVQILGFNHDVTDDGDYVGITFGLKNALETPYELGLVSTTESISWELGDLRTYVAGLKDDLPSELQAVIKTVIKSTAAENCTEAIVETEEDLFLFSHIEIFGTYYLGSSTQYSSSGEGHQYEYYLGKTWFSSTKRYGANILGSSVTYAANTYYQENAVKCVGDAKTNVCSWILRSPSYSTVGVYNFAGSDGALLTTTASTALSDAYIVYGFCV